jgi:hypothetical protein
MTWRKSANYLGMIFFCTFVSATSQVASARPIGGGGTPQCVCACFVTSAWFEWNFYDNVGAYGCVGFEGATCNLYDDETGGVRSGSLAFCDDWPVREPRYSSRRTHETLVFTSHGPKVVTRPHSILPKEIDDLRDW